MERRKVIRQGKGTLTMSLPMRWVKQLKLQTGDELDVEQRGLQLIIGPGRKQHLTKTDIDLRGFSKDLVFVILNNLYIRGDEELHLHFDTPEIYDAISQSTPSLIGFEIVEQTATSCTLKELARGEHEDFDMLLRRIFLLILANAEEGVTAFKTNNTALLTGLQTRDKAVNTLVNYCLRMLNKHGGADIQRAMHLYALLILLEKLGDEYERFYRDVPKITTKTLLLTKDVAKLLRDFYELFYTFEKQRANNLKHYRDTIKNNIKTTLLTTRNRDDLLALQHLRSIADLIIDIEKFHLAMQI